MRYGEVSRLSRELEGRFNRRRRTSDAGVSIAAILSAAPGPSVRLWQATKSGDHATALDLHERLLVLWNAIVGDALPATTKCAQILQGIPAGQPRQPMSMPSEQQQAVIRKALQGLDLV